MDNLLIAALSDIGFINRYKTLSKNYQGKNPLEDYEKDKVRKIIKDLGYDAKYVKNGDFFEVKQTDADYLFQLNICLKYGIAELILYIEKKGTAIEKTGSFGYICSLLGEREKIFKPVFTNYNELQNILKESLKIFEDLQKRFHKI